MVFGSCFFVGSFLIVGEGTSGVFGLAGGRSEGSYEKRGASIFQGFGKAEEVGDWRCIGLSFFVEEVFPLLEGRNSSA